MVKQCVHFIELLSKLVTSIVKCNIYNAVNVNCPRTYLAFNLSQYT